MKTVIIVLIASLAMACEVSRVDSPDIDTVQSNLCTEEDQDDDNCPIEDQPQGEELPMDTDLVEEMARQIGPNVSCDWDRCGPDGGYVCRTSNGGMCILTRTGYLFCSTRYCINSDLVCYGYRCSDWNNRPKL